MKIRLNGQEAETSATTVALLLAELEEAEKISLEAVAVAVNGEFAPASKHAETALAEGDAVEIVSPRQGG